MLTFSIIPVLIIGLGLLVSTIFIELAERSAGGVSPLRLLNRKLFLPEYNELYFCNHDECKKPFRFYQSLLLNPNDHIHRERNSTAIIACPHCKRHTLTELVTEEIKPLDYHMECPKLFGVIQRHKMKSTIKKLSKFHEEVELEEKYSKYITEKPDLSWIDNVQEFATRSKNQKKRSDLEKTFEGLKEQHVWSNR